MFKTNSDLRPCKWQYAGVTDLIYNSKITIFSDLELWCSHAIVLWNKLQVWVDCYLCQLRMLCLYFIVFIIYDLKIQGDVSPNLDNKIYSFPENIVYFEMKCGSFQNFFLIFYIYRLAFPEDNNRSLKKISKLEDPAQHSRLGLVVRCSVNLKVYQFHSKF